MAADALQHGLEAVVRALRHGVLLRAVRSTGVAAVQRRDEARLAVVAGLADGSDPTEDGTT